MRPRGLLISSLLVASTLLACRTNYEADDESSSTDSSSSNADAGEDASSDGGVESTTDSMSDSGSNSAGDGDTASGDGDVSTGDGDGDGGDGDSGDGDTSSEPECGDGQHEAGELCFDAYAEHQIAHDLDSIDAGDITGDGRPDVVGVLESSEVILSVVNQGDGTFSNGAPHTAQSGVNNDDIVIIEVNHDADGHPDQVFTNNGFSQMTILAGDGSGNLAATETSSEYWYMGPMDVLEVVDANGDDYDDMLAGLGDGSLVVSTGSSSGGLSHPADPIDDDAHIGCEPSDLVVAQMAGAGKRPFLVCEGLDEVHEWALNGQGTLSFLGTHGVGMAPTGVDACDLDGNNYDDIVVSAAGEDEVTILFFDANGLMDSAQLDVGPSPQAVRCVDMNADGHLDIVTVNDGGLGQESVTIRVGEGGGSFDISAVDIPLNEANPRDPRDMEIADFDGDGSLDIVVAFGYHNESQQQEPAIGVLLSNP